MQILSHGTRDKQNLQFLNIFMSIIGEKPLKEEMKNLLNLDVYNILR